MTSMVTPDGELEAGTAYAVRVKAYNGIGWSEVICVVGSDLEQSPSSQEKYRQCLVQTA